MQRREDAGILLYHPLIRYIRKVELPTYGGDGVQTSGAMGREHCAAKAVRHRAFGCAPTAFVIGAPGAGPSSALSSSEAHSQRHLTSTPVGTNYQRLMDFQPVTLETDRRCCHIQTPHPGASRPDLADR